MMTRVRHTQDGVGKRFNSDQDLDKDNNANDSTFLSSQVLNGKDDNATHYSLPYRPTIQAGNRHIIINNSPTSKMLPARGVVRGLMTSNGLQRQTTESTVCPQTHQPATRLPKPYLIATNTLKALELWSLRKAKPDLPWISQPETLTKTISAVV